MFGWLRRNPKIGLGATILTSLVLGAVIGFLVGDDRAQTDRERARADAAESELASVAEQRDELETRADQAEERASELREEVKRLSASGRVPSFVGEDAAEADAHELVDSYGWKIETTTEVSDQEPGTVISQSPPEGTELDYGREITLVVAKEPPPEPPQWVTVATLSGGGATKTDEFRIPPGSRARLSYNMPDDTNNAITLYRPPKRYIDLLLNEIGPQSGTTRLYGSGTFYLDVTGSYTIEVQVFKRPE